MTFPTTHNYCTGMEELGSSLGVASSGNSRKRAWKGREVGVEPPAKRKRITEDQVKGWTKEFNQESKNLLLRNVVVNAGLVQAATDTEEARRVSHIFSNTAVGDVKATDQESSGRCWIFAGLNVMRRFMCKQHNLTDFEFSQNYLAFWDKLERANYYLQEILKTKEKELDDPQVNWMVSDPIGDGGEWVFFANLVEKYGVVPRSAMPETFHSGYTTKFNEILENKLREFARSLRDKGEASEEDLLEMKEKMLQQIYNVLVTFLGQPPETFTWEFKDNDEAIHTYKKLTPKKFLEDHVPDFKVGEQVVLTNMPQSDRPYYKKYEVTHYKNISEGSAVTFINLPIWELKKFAVKSIKDGNPLWFGCDIDKGLHSELGVLSTKIYNFDMLFGSGEPLSKEDRISYHQSSATHAMVLTGVNLDNSKPNRWQVENSWGDESGKGGFLTMTNEWFDEYVFDIVVDRKYLSRRVLSVLKESAIAIKPWEGIGKALLGSCTTCMSRCCC
ncbi:MAG: bleomycin hydrolase [Chlamydiales bacterium]|jgi:bleomycin hydrolase